MLETLWVILRGLVVIVNYNRDKNTKIPVESPSFWREPDVTQHMLSYVIVKRNYGESLVRGIKLSVEVRNDVYKRVFVVLDSSINFNDQFREFFWPKVKNLTCTIPSVNPNWSFLIENIVLDLETLRSRPKNKKLEVFNELTSIISLKKC